MQFVLANLMQISFLNKTQNVGINFKFERKDLIELSIPDHTDFYLKILNRKNPNFARNFSQEIE